MDELLLLRDQSPSRHSQSPASYVLVSRSLPQQATEATRSQESDAAILSECQGQENPGLHLPADRTTNIAGSLSWAQVALQAQMRSGRRRHAKTSLDELLSIRGTKSLATGGNESQPAGTMCSMWSHYYRGSPSKCAQQENERESIGICNDESGLMPSLSSGTHPSAATQQASTGKAEYSERGPLSLREHGGETYSGQPEHRRSTLTPPQPNSPRKETSNISSDEASN